MEPDVGRLVVDVLGEAAARDLLAVISRTDRERAELISLTRLKWFSVARLQADPLPLRRVD
jgi:hypothetical protein